jgi:hypothetical protein
MKKDWRFYLGIALLLANLAGYGLAALVPFLGFSAAGAAGWVGAIILLSELAFVAGVALLGRPFLELLKAKVKTWFLRKPAAPPAPVSRARHRAGLVMLGLSCLPYFIAEFMLILGYTAPGHIRFIIGMLLASDVLFLASLIVLGGEFWERLKKLFAWPGAASG